MSFFTSIKKKTTLSAATKQVAKARKEEGAKADELYKSAYEGFEFVLSDNLMIAETLYNWGLGLLHHAKSKEGDVAVATYEEAINKFSFCLTMDKYYLGAAIDGGVAYMDLARLLEAAIDDKLYAKAQKFFEQAEEIQKGSAAYNLACLHALSGNHEACLEALKLSKEFGSLPDETDINNDPDIADVAQEAWFVEFMQARAEEIEAEKRAEEERKKAKAEAKLKAQQEANGAVDVDIEKPEDSAESTDEAEATKTSEENANEKSE